MFYSITTNVKNNEVIYIGISQVLKISCSTVYGKFVVIELILHDIGRLQNIGEDIKNKLREFT